MAKLSFFNIANFLTGLRFFGAPVLVFLYFDNNFTTAFWLMLFLGITDWFDGFFARKLKIESLFGKLFDPIADKTLMITMFATLGYLKAIPYNLVILCLARDVLIIIGALCMIKQEFINSISPTKSSKINTFLQIVLIVTVTFRLSKNNVSQAFLFAENILILLTGLFTVASGVEYAKIFWNFLKRNE